MLVWPMAAKAPSAIEAIATTITICCHWPTQVPNGPISTRMARPTAATLGAPAMNAVTGEGEPSYTSGVHMWNGTADILKARPATMNTRPTSAPSGSGAPVPACHSVARRSNSIVPVKP